MTRLIDLTMPWSAATRPYPGHPASVVRHLQRWEKDRVETYWIETSMHTGTHIDAPIHMSAGGLDLAAIPLEQLYGSTVVVDLSDRVKDWTLITPQMVEEAAPDEIRPGDRVILYYNWSRYASSGSEPYPEKYYCRHPGPSVELVHWLIDRQIAWIGTDSASFEHPMNVFVQSRPDLVAEYEQMYGVSVKHLHPQEHWLAAHHLMGERNICHIDQIGGDIALVKGSRVDVGVFPWRFVGGEACISRVVAFLPD